MNAFHAVPESVAQHDWTTLLHKFIDIPILLRRSTSHIKIIVTVLYEITLYTCNTWHTFEFNVQKESYLFNIQKQWNMIIVKFILITSASLKRNSEFRKKYEKIHLTTKNETATTYFRM